MPRSQAKIIFIRHKRELGWFSMQANEAINKVLNRCHSHTSSHWSAVNLYDNTLHQLLQLYNRGKYSFVNKQVGPRRRNNKCKLCGEIAGHYAAKRCPKHPDYVAKYDKHDDLEIRELESVMSGLLGTPAAVNDSDVPPGDGAGAASGGEGEGE